MKDYNIIAFDAQYFLHRNFAALKSRTAYNMVSYLPSEVKTEKLGNDGYVIVRYDFTSMTLVKHFVWTICKFIRDSFSCNKIILLWDKPPYHKTRLLNDYKGTRVHHSKELLDEWDVESDPIGYLQELEDYKYELIKQEAKYFIINNLDKIGMPSIIHEGYEADDLAWMFGQIIDNEEVEQKSAICSVDSDWQYWIGNNVDFLNFNKSEVWTIDDVNDDCEGLIKKLDLSLIEAKQIMDSTFYGHNDLKRTTDCTWKDFEQLVTTIRDKDYSLITDKETFDKNMKSFEIWNYPDFQMVNDKISTAINSDRSYLTLDDWITFHNKYGLDITNSYYSNYVKLMSSDETVEEG